MCTSAKQNGIYVNRLRGWCWWNWKCKVLLICLFIFNSQWVIYWCLELKSKKKKLSRRCMLIRIGDMTVAAKTNGSLWMAANVIVAQYRSEIISSYKWFAKSWPKCDGRWAQYNFIKLWIHFCCAISHLTLKRNGIDDRIHSAYICTYFTWDSQFLPSPLRRLVFRVDRRVDEYLVLMHV